MEGKLQDEFLESRFTDAFDFLEHKVEILQMHERNLENSINDIIKLVNEHDEELALDCEQIVDKWSQS